MTELRQGLEDPLAVVRTINRIHDYLQGFSLDVVMSEDMSEFRSTRQLLRNDLPSPMFDCEVTCLADRGFWIGLRRANGEVVALQACRLDTIDTNLAEWAVGWMTGLYLKRNVLMVPARLKPFSASRSFGVTGRVVYHGELWLDPESNRGEGVASAFCFLGMVIAHMKWQPNAIWALVSNSLATRGHATRFGYPHVERSFLNWEWSTDDVPANEWLLLAEFEDMEHLVSEYAERGPIIRS
jgi:hypothetical protein